MCDRQQELGAFIAQGHGSFAISNPDYTIANLIEGLAIERRINDVLRDSHKRAQRLEARERVLLKIADAADRVDKRADWFEKLSTALAEWKALKATIR